MRTTEQHRPTVLVVDDDEVMRLSARESLQGAGLKVCECESGEAALEGPDDYDGLVTSYKEAFTDLRNKGEVDDPLYPGALEVLEVLEAAGWVLGVATGKGRRGLLMTLETHRLTDRFQTLQTADSGPGKPNPDMLLNAMRETGADPAATAMIGDTTFDMEMAKRAGTMAVGVSWGYHLGEHLYSAGAQAVIEEFRDLPETIETLGKVSK